MDLTIDFLKELQERSNAPIPFGERGLEPSEIDSIEKELGFPFPQDFRFFLQNTAGSGNALFPWWEFSEVRYTQSIEHILEGLLFDVQHDELWLERWGDKPSTFTDAESLIRRDFGKWPKLLPISGHRYMAAEPCENGNPVFSIMQSDIIYYGRDLADYLWREFTPAFSLDTPKDPIKFIPIWSNFAESTDGFATGGWFKD